MKEMIKEWLGQQTRFRGLLAGAARCTDETFFMRIGAETFPRENLENALRCIADTFQVLRLRQLPNEQIRWTYEKAMVSCIKRRDGAFLGVFTNRDPQVVDLEALDKMLAEFYRMGAGDETQPPVPPVE